MNHSWAMYSVNESNWVSKTLRMHDRDSTDFGLGTTIYVWLSSIELNPLTNHIVFQWIIFNGW
jgi:hypothetical protein